MNTNNTTCATCGTVFEARSARARYCSASCRGKAHRLKPEHAPTTTAPADPAAVGMIETAARHKLDAVPDLDPLARAQVLGLARRLDDPNTPGGSVAALARELRAEFARLNLPEPVTDPIAAVQEEAARLLATLPGYTPPPK